jgi:hypothetical protein
MKKLLLMVTIGLLYPMAIQAMTLVDDPAQNTPSATVVTTEFGLSGTISRYSPQANKITIDGQKYKLQTRGRLSENNLVPGQKIKFNVEKPASGEISRITKIWLETKEP